jgi:DNA-binding response OmpR family regulator
MNILMIEDDRNIADFMETALQIGWPEAKLLYASRGTIGIEMAETASPDIILLDLGLPDLSGFDVLRKIRSFSEVPIIITTVTGEEAYVVKGLALGANDYITKPLRPLEMIARMKALTKLSNSDDDLSVSCGNLRFGISLRELYKGNRLINLTNIEGRIMYVLMKNAGKLITYSALAREVWGEHYPGVEDTQKSHICHLRQKIEDDPGHPTCILNTPGAGYVLTKSGC